MKKIRKYKNGAMAAIHETALGLHEIGLMDDKTLQELDQLCLAPLRNLEPEEIRGIRMREGVSRTMFARCLNVSPGLVGQWERGDKKPGGPSLKLLTLVRDKGLGALL